MNTLESGNMTEVTEKKGVFVFISVTSYLLP